MKQKFVRVIVIPLLLLTILDLSVSYIYFNKSQSMITNQASHGPVQLGTVFFHDHNGRKGLSISSPLHLYRIKTLAEKFGEPGMRFSCSSYWEHYLQHNSLRQIFTFRVKRFLST